MKISYLIFYQKKSLFIALDISLILLTIIPAPVFFAISTEFPALKDINGKPEDADSYKTNGEHSNLDPNKNP